MEYSACSYDPQNPSLPFLICEHRFCRDCAETMKGGQDCPITDCRGKNHDKSSCQGDEQLIRKIIKKRCFAEDGEVLTDNVARSSRRNQSSLTSG